MTTYRLLLGSLLLPLLAACGDSSAPPATDPAASAASTAASGTQAQNAALPATAELKIFNWSDYVDPETVKAFEAENKVKVHYDYYDSDETLEAKVLTGRSGYDLVTPSNAFVGRQIKVGAYQKLDKSLISNYKLINPKLLELMQGVDPGNDYAVPYFWGTNTFAINVEKVKAALGGTLPEKEWDLVFNPEYTAKLKGCGITYLDSASEMYTMTLHYMGKDPNSNKPEDIKAATELLQANRPNIRRFTSSGFIDSMARGDVCVAVGFGGDLNIAKRRAKEAGYKHTVEVMMPKEGVGVWVDSFTIPKDARNLANAYRYIDHILIPEVAAKNGDYVSYAPSSMPAKALMLPEYRDDPSIFPPDDEFKHSYIMLPHDPDALKVMVRNWQGIKAGR